jgi:hypothetical protein
MCVSTKIPWSDSGWGQQFAITTFAVFRATPRSVVSSSIVLGTSPPNFSTRSFEVPMIDFVFCRKNPVGYMSFSTASGSASASACGVGYALKSNGVTLLTVSSVDCADMMVATSNCHGSS